MTKTESYCNEVVTWVYVDINDPDVIERITGPGGDEWRSVFYNLKTRQDVIEHLTYNFLVNGVDRVNRLEGWGDVADDAVTFTLGSIDHHVEDWS